VPATLGSGARHGALHPRVAVVDQAREPARRSGARPREIAVAAARFTPHMARRAARRRPPSVGAQHDEVVALDKVIYVE
jgi:hypothetical protein